MAPTFGVIVPARDAAATIGACVDGLLAAGVRARDVVVVDDGSRDATAEIARASGVRVVATAGGAGAAAARNLGTARSGGGLIVFVDADVRVAPDAIARIVEAFGGDGAPDALFGSYDDAPPAPGLVSRVRNLLHHHVHQTNGGPAETFWTGLGAVRRDAFDAVGGFAAGQRMMEDVRLGRDLRRAGYRIALRPDIQGAHLKRWTLRSMLRTDLLDRAIPWSRMLLAPSGPAPRALNVSRAGMLSVAAAGLSLLALALLAPAASLHAMAGAGAAATASIAVAAIVVLNRGFLGLVGRRLGAMAVVPATGVLWLHLVASGLGYAWAWLERLAGRLPA